MQVPFYFLIITRPRPFTQWWMYWGPRATLKEETHLAQRLLEQIIDVMLTLGPGTIEDPSIAQK